VSNSRLISQNIRGMIFLGTPFRGSSTAKFGEVSRRLLSAFGVDTQEKTLKLLGVDSDRLNDLTRSFSELLNKRRISKKSEDSIAAFFFYETLKLRIVQVRAFPLLFHRL
jgi:protein SERAC1